MAMSTLMAIFLLLLHTSTILVSQPIVTGKCGSPKLPLGVPPMTCCLQLQPTEYHTFTHSSDSPARVRLAAHLVDRVYVQKYKRAVELMKALPSTDPRSFFQQANLHCAYCNEAYRQSGFRDLPVQIHNSWLFYPWHRFYLYFYERILGKLIRDPTFGLPFWNWDAPEGMQMPSIYTNDPRRNPYHQPPTLITLDWGFHNSENTTDQERIASNVGFMHGQMVGSIGNTSEFLGMPYRAGDQPHPPQFGGSIERKPHGRVHEWTGDNSTAHLEDMGSFYTSGRDPMFFAHHANVDRLWTLWKSIGGVDYASDDWLNSTFLFHDEDARPVRVKVSDCLDEKNLGYEYETVDIPWI